jgi:hypothetical protein
MRRLGHRVASVQAPVPTNATRLLRTFIASVACWLMAATLVGATQTLTLTRPTQGTNATVGQPLGITWTDINTDVDAVASTELALVIVSCPNNYVAVGVHCAV